jgi:DNA repair ATPase RecN
MTPAERTEHQQRMRSIKTYDECKTYMEQHREQMAARAKEKGKALAQPRRDACAGLKP